MFTQEEILKLIKEGIISVHMLIGQNRIEEAEIVAKQILKVFPEHLVALKLLGFCQYKNNKYPNAISTYEKALKINEDSEIHNNLALCYSCMREYDKAISHLEQSDINAMMLGNMGHQYRKKEEYKKAEEYLKKAIEIEETEIHLTNLAGIYGDQNKISKAVSTLERALEINEDYLPARMDLAYSYHLLGDWEKGRKEYEHRFKCYPHLKKYEEKYPPEKMWNGEPYEKLSVYCEQGVGDYFNFIRFTKELPNVVIDATEPLIEFTRKQELEVGSPDDYTFHCSMTSIPYILNIHPDNICNEYPYLHSTKKANFDKYPNFKIGLIWAGNPEHARDEFRSIKLETFKPICNVPNTHLFSLQKDLRKRVWTGTQPIDLSMGCEDMNLIDMSEFMSDWEDTAAIINEMDLIITADTAILHLAGAMGKPTWALIPYNPDWRWGLEGENTIWYPSVKLFRQTERRNWDSVIGINLQESF